MHLLRYDPNDYPTLSVRQTTRSVTDLVAGSCGVGLRGNLPGFQLSPGLFRKCGYYRPQQRVYRLRRPEYGSNIRVQ
jgi:hypothetical protein